MGQKRIAIIACSARQSNKGATTAENLYQGSLFRYGLAYAREVLKLPESDIYILSTKYGLIRLSQPIESPYDVAVHEVRKDFGREVAAAIEQVRGDAEELRIYTFLGKETIQGFKPFLSPYCQLESVYAKARKTEERSGIGYIISFLKREVETKRSERTK